VYLAALLVAAGTLMVGSGTAQALTVDQSCVGTEVTSYNPLSLSPRGMSRLL
jgi:hypothetical protein